MISVQSKSEGEELLGGASLIWSNNSTIYLMEKFWKLW